MNFFEDLVEELKEENLIEETVIETSLQEANAYQLKKQPDPPSSEKESIIETFESDMTSGFAEKPEIDVLGNNSEMIETSAATTASPVPQPIIEQATAKTSTPLAKPMISEAEFFRRRAAEEVTSLQIVEHILSGVEREQMKIQPKSYNDIAVGMALHDFLQMTADVQSPEHTKAEFKLMEETESWYSALAQRDKYISVGDLRRYCETTRPTLSPQALISLARFYRNSPFSDAVRSKFDMVVTRLVSRETENDSREIVFDRSQLVEHLTGLYAEWSSIPLYAADDDSEVLISVLKFEDFINEAKSADSFEELVKNDFFNRLRIFKSNTGENFFAPLLTATAIESNVVIGNRYVDLISEAREKDGGALLKDKYKFLLDQTVSDVTSKTLQLVELLSEKEEGPEPEPEITEVLEISTPAKAEKKNKQTGETVRSKLFQVNKWLLGFTILTVMLSGGLFVYVEYLTPQQAISPDVKKVNLDNSALKDFFKAARINKEILYVIAQPTWKNLSTEIKEDVMKRALSAGGEQGYTKVYLLSAEGKTIGFASAESIKVEGLE